MAQEPKPVRAPKAWFFRVPRAVALALALLSAGAALGDNPPEEPAVFSESAPVEWVTTLQSARDVTGKESWFKRLWKTVVGLEDRQQTLWQPNGLCVDNQGRLLVADSRARVVHVFDAPRHRYQRLEAPASDPFGAPVAVSTDAQDRIYVSDSLRSRVFVFSPGGKFLRTLGGIDRLESIFKRATGIAVDSRRNLLFVVDTVAMRIVVLSLDGRVVSRFGRQGTAAGEFNYPTHIAVAGDGTLWVTDSLNFRIQHLSAEGKVLGVFGEAGRRAGAFDKAKGIAVDEAGRVYVVEGLQDRVQVFDGKGGLLFTFGSTGVRPGEFFLPAGIALDRQGRIYVADSYNRRVQVFRLRAAAPLPAGGD